MSRSLHAPCIVIMFFDTMLLLFALLSDSVEYQTIKITNHFFRVLSATNIYIVYNNYINSVCEPSQAAGQIILFTPSVKSMPFCLHTIVAIQSR